MIDPHRIIPNVKCSNCGQEDWKYICPRCERVTCSMNCQKSHSTSCQSAFQHELATESMEGMRQTFPQREEFKKTLNTANKAIDKIDDLKDSFIEDNEEDNYSEEYNDYELENASDNDEEQTIEIERNNHLKNLATSGKLTWDDLNDEEKMKFRGALARGLLTEEISEVYHPWYYSIECYTEDSNIPHVCCNDNRTVSQSVFWQVVKLVQSWLIINITTHGDILLDEELQAYTKNGEFKKIKSLVKKNPDNGDRLDDSLLLEGELRLSELCGLSNILEVVKKEQSIQDCIQVSIEATSSVWGYPKANAKAAVNDLHLIFTHYSKVIRMLTMIQDFIDLINRSIKSLIKQNDDNDDDHKEITILCKKLMMKVQFLISFSKYHFATYPTPDQSLFQTINQD